MSTLGTTIDYELGLLSRAMEVANQGPEWGKDVNLYIPCALEAIACVLLAQEMRVRRESP